MPRTRELARRLRVTTADLTLRSATKRALSTTSRDRGYVVFQRWPGESTSACCTRAPRQRPSGPNQSGKSWGKGARGEGDPRGRRRHAAGGAGGCRPNFSYWLRTLSAGGPEYVDWKQASRELGALVNGGRQGEIMKTPPRPGCVGRQQQRYASMPASFTLAAPQASRPWRGPSRPSRRTPRSRGARLGRRRGPRPALSSTVGWGGAGWVAEHADCVHRALGAGSALPCSATMILHRVQRITLIVDCPAPPRSTRLSDDRLSPS